MNSVPWLPAPLHEVAGYFVSGFLWSGAVLAVQITAISMTLGLVLGLGLALMRLSRFSPLRSIAWAYIWFVRGTPQLLQLVFIFDALPLIGIKFDSFSTAVIGFSLNQAAFAGEIIRGGILSVNRQQSVAAASLGMGGMLTMRRIVLPQAMRAILPAIGNDTIGMLKMTSIASVIFVNELTFRAEQIVGQNFKFFTVFAGAALIYLLLTSIISLGQAVLERRFNPERTRRDVPPPPARVATTSLSAALTIDHADDAVPGVPFVVCRDVHKSYAGQEVLRGIDLTVARGEVVVIIGASGSGKSTLLRLVNHLETIDRGEITVAGHHVGYIRQGDRLRPSGDLARARAEARIAMVFQHFNLFNHLTALENVTEAPIRVHRVPERDANALAHRLLDLVGLGGYARRMPHQLSGGQQQRVAIARALAISPRLMLFDEPTSALDPELVGEVLNTIRRLADAGMTMMIVTHEIRFAREVADRVVFLDEGRIIEEGPPESLLDNPSHERTRRFLRMIAQVDEGDGMALALAAESLTPPR